MKIVFMGTPDFAKESLEAVYNSKNEVLAVVTNPDKPKGRGMKMIASPVKEFALEKNFKIYQPTKVRNNAEFIEEIKALNPDLLCVVAYGKILPKELLDIPKYGAINVHGSLLPEYRGAAPIQWAVLNGDKRTGITTMFMDIGMDTGDMILKEETEIGEDETTGELWDRLSKIGAKLLVKTIEKIEQAKEQIEQEEDKNKKKKTKSVTNNNLKSNNRATIEKAALMIFLNKTCFNGLFRVNKKGLFNVPMGSYKNPLICDEHNLRAVSNKLQKVTIVCGDYRESANFIDNRTFVYFDPPYRPITNTANFTAYTEQLFNDKEQIELARFVDDMDRKGAKVVVSNSDPKNSDAEDNFFDNVYSRHKIKRVEATRMINCNSKGRGKIKELLISNF